MAETPKKETPTLNPGRFQLAEHARAVHAATAEAGTTFQQMLDPNYWAHEARKLQPYDHIECRCDDGTFWGLLLVLEVGRSWAKVHPLQHEPLTTADVAQTQAVLASDEYRVEWKGPIKKYAVIRNQDNEIIHDGEQRKEGAQEWLQEHLKAYA